MNQYHGTIVKHTIVDNSELIITTCSYFSSFFFIMQQNQGTVPKDSNVTWNFSAQWLVCTIVRDGRTYSPKMMMTLICIFESKLHQYDSTLRQWKWNCVHYLGVNGLVSARKYCTHVSAFRPIKISQGRGLNAWLCTMQCNTSTT